ncbi:MAG TPA: aminoglycoside phosphotransferase family protein [Actinomycetota bacterium]
MRGLQTFRIATEDRIGDAAKPWGTGLRALVDELVTRWELDLGDPAETGGVAYAVPATRSGDRSVVLKLAYPDAWFFEEIAALSQWDGNGAVTLLDHDPRGAQLLAGVEPGTPLAALEDEDEALERAAAVAERLWIPDPGGIATVTSEAQEWGRTMLGRHHLAGRPFERELVHEAAGAIRDLIATAPRGVLLHGDLTLANVLDGGEHGDVATNPRPLVGEPEFDAAALLRSSPDVLAADPEHARDRVQHRFDLVRERLGLEGSRLKSWALAVSVDEAIWDFEQGAISAGRRQTDIARFVRDLLV